MKNVFKAFALLIVASFLAACGTREPMASVNINHNCDATSCLVTVDIQNPGNDRFEVDYEFAAYNSDKVIVFEIDKSLQVPANHSSSVTRYFPVESKPRMFTSGSETLRL